jgi:hypothetical protein
LDFEKAFDTIEHDKILKILQRIDFGETWFGWVQRILDIGTTSVILNGLPGKQVEIIPYLALKNYFIPFLALKNFSFPI